MPFDDILRRSLDSLVREIGSAVQAERDEAARRAKDVAEESLADQSINNPKEHPLCHAFPAPARFVARW